MWSSTTWCLCQALKPVWMHVIRMKGVATSTTTGQMQVTRTMKTASSSAPAGSVGSPRCPPSVGLPGHGGIGPGLPPGVPTPGSTYSSRKFSMMHSVVCNICIMHTLQMINENENKQSKFIQQEISLTKWLQFKKQFSNLLFSTLVRHHDPVRPVNEIEN